MARNAWGNVCLVQYGDIQVLVYIGDIDAGWTWEAMVAVHAVPLEVALEIPKHGAVVPLCVAFFEVSNGFHHIFS